MSEVSLSVGPQHPGSGHFRLLVKLDGDIILEAKPDPGYVHRGVEKIAETRNYIKNIPLLERPTIIDSGHMNMAYVMAIEELQGITVPKRGWYLRCLLGELNRIMSHLYWLGIYGPFVGHLTIFMWGLGDREIFIDLAQMLTGARLTHSYIIPGGVRYDLPEGFTDKALKAVEYFERRLKEYDDMYFSNPIFTKRTKGIGVLKPEEAIALGVVGQTARASGLKVDVRKDEPYGIYDELEFEIPTYEDGDTWARTMVHAQELRISCDLIRQIVKKIPQGPYRRKAPIIVPRGESYGRVEAARGELGYFLIGQGNDKPYRLKMSTPSFRNLAAMPKLLKGVHLADMPAIYWSLDYWPVDADR